MISKTQFIAVGACLFCLTAAAQPAPKLLPFQARLTDQNGFAVTNGARLVQFKIFNVPTGGNPVWAGELHRTTVNGGLVNVMLGTKTPLNGVDFDQQLYLEITVDVSGPGGQPDSAITASDPPMLPRQAILPAIYAKESGVSRDSQKLNGSDWTPIFGVNDPNLPIPASKLADASLPGGKIQVGTITSNQIAAQTITAGLIASGTITSNQIGSGAVDISNLAQQVAEALNPPGTVVAFAGETIPAGWLLCDGSLKPILGYPRLSQAIGTRWGTNSTTQFRLPDLRGVFLRGVTGNRNDGLQDPGDGRFGLYGSSALLGVGSYQGSVFQAHFHGTAINTPNNAGIDLYNTGTRLSSLFSNPGSLMFGGGNGVSSAQNSEQVGGSETRPKNAYVNYIIKY